MIFDRALIPWENVLAYDVDQANGFMPRSGFINRAMFQGLLRLGVKLDFIAGLLLKATEAAGNKKTPRVQASVGEVIAWRNVVWALTDGMIQGCEPWADGSVQPNCAYALAVPPLGPHHLRPDQGDHRAHGRLQPDLPQLQRGRLQEPGDARRTSTSTCAAPTTTARSTGRR